MSIVDANGREILVKTQEQTDLDSQGFFETYEEWNTRSIITTSRGAWDYKNTEIAEILKGFDKSVATQVFKVNEGITATLKQKNKTIEELKAFIEENIQLIQDLEVKLGEQGVIVDITNE